MAEKQNTIPKNNDLVSKEDIYQAINIFANKDFDPNSDEEVLNVLNNVLNIRLPQRSSLNDSLASAASDHEIIELILKYRTMP